MRSIGSVGTLAGMAFPKRRASEMELSMPPGFYAKGDSLMFTVGRLVRRFRVVETVRLTESGLVRFEALP